MYKRYSGVAFWLVGNFTLGIYTMIVWHGMAKNMNKMARTVGENTIMGYIPAMLLGCVTFGIYPIVWLFKFFGLMGRLSEKKAANITPDGTFVKLLMSIIPIYSFFWMTSSYNKLANAYEA